MQLNPQRKRSLFPVFLPDAQIIFSLFRPEYLVKDKARYLFFARAEITAAYIMTDIQIHCFRFSNMLFKVFVTNLRPFTVCKNPFCFFKKCLLHSFRFLYFILSFLICILLHSIQPYFSFQLYPPTCSQYYNFYSEMYFFRICFAQKNNSAKHTVIPLITYTNYCPYFTYIFTRFHHSFSPHLVSYCNIYEIL